MSLRTVRIASAAVLLTGVACVVSEIAFQRTKRGTYVSLFYMALFAITWIVGVVVFIRSVRKWRSWSAILGGLLFITAAVSYVAPVFGVKLRDRDFATHVAAMETTVAQLRQLPDSVLDTLRFEPVPPALRDVVYRVMTQRPRRGELSVFFFYGGMMLPPRHAVWLYTADSSATAETVRQGGWRIARPLRAHWFDVQD
ncbi:MAG TPA: hypothetical protein VFK13_08810 [Gemmatimonadaceae bacterium]|nr:hypothetical protein [Gemmatimonadaceae bacterium]